MFNYKPYIKSLLSYMIENGYTVKPYPKFVLNEKDPKDNVFAPTGYYDPETKTVVAYVKNRFCKDVLRSIAHELIHHKQNMEGRLGEGAYSGQRIVDDNKLIKLEEEAFLQGNIGFRKWTEIMNKKDKDGDE